MLFSDALVIGGMLSHEEIATRSHDAPTPTLCRTNPRTPTRALGGFLSLPSPFFE